jgi:hypothetical protein
MKTRSLFLASVLLCSILPGLHVAAAKAQDNKAKIPEAELKAAQTVETAADATAKLAAAEVFVKKYPKSAARKNVAGYIADQIRGEKDPSQKLMLAQRALTIFTEESEASDIEPSLIDAYLKLNKFDEAFNEGSAFLTKNPENIQILINLAIIGTEQAKQRNAKYVTQSRQYGLKAIELLEADKKPPTMEDAVWGRYKAMLPQLYQEIGLISLIQQNPTDAKAKLEKAAKLSPGDPFNYVLLGGITNDEYQSVAQTYKNMPDGKARDDMLTKANQLIDKVIDQYARAVALSEGKPEYQKLHDQIMQDLTSYYKYRHSSSTEGLQKLIDGYKTPANP